MSDFVDSSKEKIAGDIVENRTDIWLVWTLDVNNIVSLRNICTEQRFANFYRKMLVSHDNIVRAWIEKTITNHLYGNASFERYYGGGPIRYIQR